jgi:hypothetical protein
MLYAGRPISFPKSVGAPGVVTGTGDLSALVPQLLSDLTGHIYGDLDVTQVQNLPSLATIQAKPRLPKRIGGFYMWYNDLDASSFNLGPGFSFCGPILIIRVGTPNNFFLSDENWTSISTYCTTYGAVPMLMCTGAYRNTFATDADFLAAYNAYVGAILTRVGPGGTFHTDHPTVPWTPLGAIEFWNEPNDQNWFWGNYGLHTAEETADLLARCLISVSAYVRANAAWNSVKMVAGALSRGGILEGVDQKIFDARVFDHIVSNGGVVANCFDAWSNHPYTFDYPPDTHVAVPGNYESSSINTLAAERAALDAHGCSSKPIWWTEVGWTRPSGDGAFDPIQTAYHNTARQQAAYIVRLWLTAMRCGIETVHTFFDTDGAQWNAGCIHYMGYGQPLAYYEAGYAIRFFAQLLPNPIIRSAISDGVLGYYAYELQPDAGNDLGTSVIALWNVAGAVSATITLSAGVHTVYDMFGNVGTVVSTGSVSLPVGPYPIYVVGT